MVRGPELGGQHGPVCFDMGTIVMMAMMVRGLAIEPLSLAHWTLHWDTYPLWIP